MSFFIMINHALAVDNSIFPKENKSPLSLANQQERKALPLSTNYITENGFYQTLKNDSNNVYFDFDKSDIKPNAKVILDQHASVLLSNPIYRIMIEGHADERGSVEYNLALGERRAQAIKHYLVAKGVSPIQLYTVSYGKEKLAYWGHNAASHAKNRRGILVY